jgi:hypothetical protein
MDRLQLKPLIDAMVAEHYRDTPNSVLLPMINAKCHPFVLTMGGLVHVAQRMKLVKSKEIRRAILAQTMTKVRASYAADIKAERVRPPNLIPPRNPGVWPEGIRFDDDARAGRREGRWQQRSVTLHSEVGCAAEMCAS